MSDMKEMCTIVHKDPEERIYLVCFRSCNDHWEICNGRRDAYELIKEYILNGMSIDLDDGFVLVETCTLSQRKPLVKFMKFCQSIYKDGFDISEYYDSISENDYEDQQQNEVNNNLDSITRLSMQSILNGEIVGVEE